MNILAISTSGKAASAALIRDGAVIKSALSDNGLTHSETIMPLVDSLFEYPHALSEIDAFAADVGPGSFTGVRIGVCVINAMATALHKPVIEVSSLEALALAADSSGLVCPLLDARNGNGYAALYQNGGEVIPPSAVVVEEFLSRLPTGALFTGDGAAVYRQGIRVAVPGARFARDDLHLLTADMLASPATKKLIQGLAVEEARPLYLRPTQAERLYKNKV